MEVENDSLLDKNACWPFAHSRHSFDNMSFTHIFKEIMTLTRADIRAEPEPKAKKADWSFGQRVVPQAQHSVSGCPTRRGRAILGRV